MNNVLAIDLGRSHFRTGLFDEQGRRLLVLEGEAEGGAGRDGTLNQLAARCLELMAQTDAPVNACGLSFGGSVDFLRQSVTSDQAGWHGFELGKWMKQSLGLPCRLDNCSNAGALGEYHYGAARGTKSMVYIPLTTGLNSAIIYEGELLRGRDNRAGEIGHIPVSDSGAPCSCGARGCLESFASVGAIEARAKEYAERRPERVGRLVELSGGSEITAKGLIQAAAEGDAVALHILRETSHWLARGLLMVIRILNPDVVVLGGDVAQSGTILLDTLHTFLDELASPTITYTTELVTAALGDYSALYGAAAMGLEANQVE